MARQNNQLQLTGSVGELVSYKRNGQYFTRSKPVSVTQTENTQKACLEFGRASAAASRLMKGFYPLLQSITHARAYHRLTGIFTRIMSNSSAKAIGKRLITDGDPAPLRKFRFNEACSVEHLLKMPLPQVRVIPKSAICVDLPAFSLEDLCPAQLQATSMRIEIIGMMSDFLLDEGTVFPFDALDLSLEHDAFEGGTVSIPLSGANNKLFVWGMGVYFLNSHQNPFQNKKYAAFDIIDAFLVKKGTRVVFAAQERAADPTVTETIARRPWKLNKPRQ